ncbi:MAG: carbohydrate-binding protein [Marinoscillum sp.]
MTHFLRCFLYCLVLAGLSYSTHAQYLHSEGTKIVDGEGNEVIWRGIGLGGWMLQEGYMLGTSGAQHVLEQRIEELVGTENKEQFYDAWLANHTRKIDVDSVARWGYNMIRLPMHYKLFTPPIEEEPVAGEITWIDKGFEMTDELLEWCKANNIYLILDLHAAPGGQGENADISDYDPSKPSLWESEANQAKTVALWRKLAVRYADEPMVAAYDLINEPNWGFQNHDSDPNGCAESQNTPLWDLQKEITAAIREVDPDHIIVIEGNCWGNNYSGLPTLWDDNLVISYHKYWNGNTKEDIQGILNMRTERNAPIWLGETGENSNKWFTDCIELLEDNNIGWAWWPLKKLGLNNPLEVLYNDNYRTVVKYWNGEGAKPSQEVALAGLMKLAEDIKLENTFYHPDVVDAKIRQPHTLDTKPFKAHKLSEGQTNVIQATDYDLGRNEYAYYDKVSANYHGSTGEYTAWNSGWAYRNDGVDIEATQDESELSNGYNVGWTEDGEWMKYTVLVDSSAAYRVTIRYAGQSTSRGHFEVDGVDVTGPIDLEPTGGHQVWKDKEIAPIALYNGTRKLKFVIDKGGMNLSYFSFFLTEKLADLTFSAVSAQTNDQGNILINLNKKLDESSLTTSGFAAKVNDQEVAISATSGSGESQIQIELEGALFDSDEIVVSYTGDQVLDTDGQVLSTFSDLGVSNNLPYHVPIPGKVEAEAFVFNNGLELETTTDVGGGQNIGYTSTGDYLDYDVTVKTSGEYMVEVRVACNNNAGRLRFQQFDSDMTVINSVEVEVPITGGWQTWETVSAKMNLDQRRGVLRMIIDDPEFNVNWFSFTKISTVLEVKDLDESIIYPNPSRDFIQIKLPNSNEKGSLMIRTMEGKTVKSTDFTHLEKVDVGHLPYGLYLIEVKTDGRTIQQKLLIGE